MSVIARIPRPLRRAAEAVLPKAVVDRARRAGMRPYDPAIVVARESRAQAWFNRHILRLYYPPSMVTRESAASRWVESRLGSKLPLLYHFEIHITDHCNLNCKGCGHFSNLSKSSFVDAAKFDADLGALAEKLRVEQIYLLGGEPLLHPDVNEIIRKARARFPSTRLYVLTNGVLVTKMGEEFWRALFETGTILMCDAYPIGLPAEEIGRLAADHGVVVEWTDERDKFFKIPIDVDGSQDAADSFRRCSGICNCPMYKDGRLYPCAYSAYIDLFSDRFELDGLESTESDSISIRDNDSAAIMEFMTRPVPFCRHCDFDHFEMYPWGRTERKIEEWT